MSVTPEIDELLGLNGAEPEPEVEKHTLLELWRAVLSNIESSQAEPITPQEASRVLKSWPNLKVQELVEYHTKFYGLMTVMREILHIEIASDPECLKRTEDDAVDNRAHYLNLIMLWQLQIQEWGNEWVCTDDDAHLTMAALAEVQQFFFGQNGLLNHLDSIQFEMTEEDSDLLAETLLQSREA